MIRSLTSPLTGLAVVILAAALCGVPTSAAAQERTLTLRDGTQLAVRVEGSGPLILVLHGGPSLGYRYMESVLSLSDAYTVVLYDQRGVGRSVNAGPRPVELQHLVDDIDEIRSAIGGPPVGHGDPVILIGHSWGGHLALTYALRRPDAVAALVLVSPSEPGRRFAGRQAANLAARRTQADSAEFAGALQAYQDQEPGSVDRVYRAMYRPWFHRREAADQLDVELNQEEVERGRTTASEVAARSSGATWRDLPRVDVPTLVVHGRGDVVPLEMARELSETIPGARLRVMEGVGHFPMVEEPAALVGLIREFLRSADR